MKLNATYFVYNSSIECIKQLNQNYNRMIFGKLKSNRLTLEYSKGEVILMVVSSVLLIILNYFMITGLKAQQSAVHDVEEVQLNR